MKRITSITRIEAALDDLRQGKMVVLVADEDYENEGGATEKATPEVINFMAREGRGIELINSCPLCMTKFEDGLKDEAAQDVRVRDLTEIVAEGLR